MPEVSQVHVDAALTQVSVAFRNAEFIAPEVAPAVPVRKQSDRYFVYDAEREWLRPTDDQRAPGAEAAEVGFSVSTDSYYCHDHALTAAIPDEERENSDSALQPDIDRTEFLTEKIELNREIALETKLRTSSGLGEVTLDPAEQWDNPDNDPLPRFQTARQAVFAATQRRPNVVILPYKVFDVVRNHPLVVERIKYTSFGVVSEQLLAQLLDVEKVLVPRACRTATAKGQTPSVVPVWGNHAYMLYAAPRPGLKRITLAYTFLWTGPAGSRDGALVERWREPSRKADLIRVQRYYDLKLIAPAAGYRILDAVA